ncbi:hypothetical protein BDV98DRAFT_591309 [Pterulicium gracile]|uniref:Uncharacterized protein n=1 Tax=Pterulicium gracile TaxID=1884261 RepID=A0A5C3QRI4_9AGAR|nr:hypothetical protein BDV98DRAFT_591309 [Pterula gracilis]
MHENSSDSSGRNSRSAQQHRDALRLALGSILTPKRPSPSRSSSGSATPSLFGHTASCAATPPPPSHLSTAAFGRSATESHLPLYHHHHHHHHPSRLGTSETHYHDDDLPSPASSNSSLEVLPLISSSSGAFSPAGAHTPPHPAALVHPTPIPPPGFKCDDVPVVVVSGTHDGTGTPKAKFFETLQSKSAWDALIHGSFS